MTTSDWVLISTALFLGATALFVPLIAELLKRYVFAPEIVIEYDHSIPNVVKTYFRDPNNPSLNEVVYYFRCRIKNKGKSQARLCEAVLEDIWIYDISGNPIKFPQFTPTNIPFEGGKVSVNINPERKIYFPIGHISSPNFQQLIEENSSFIDIPGSHNKNDLRFKFDLAYYPFAQPNCLVKGKYALKISVYSENAGRKTAFFQINWSGKWEESEDIMIREINVTKIGSL